MLFIQRANAAKQVVNTATNGDDTHHKRLAKVAYFLLNRAWPRMPQPDKATSRSLLEFVQANPDMLAEHGITDVMCVAQHYLLRNNGFLLVKQLRDVGGVQDVLRVRTAELLGAIKKLADHKISQNRIKKATSNAFQQQVVDVWKLMRKIGRSGEGTSASASGVLSFEMHGQDVEVPYYNPVNRSEFMEEIKEHVKDARMSLGDAGASSSSSSPGSKAPGLSEDKHCPPLALRLAVLKCTALWIKVKKGLSSSVDERNTCTMTAASYMNAASNLLGLSMAVACAGKRYSDTARIKVDDIYFPFPGGKVPLAAILGAETPHDAQKLIEYITVHGGPIMFDVPLAKLTCGSPSNDCSRKFETVKFARFPLPPGLSALCPIVCALACMCINAKFGFFECGAPGAEGTTRSKYLVAAQSTERNEIRRAKSFVGNANAAKLHVPFQGSELVQDILKQVGGSTYGHRYQQLGELFAVRADVKSVSVLMGHSSVISQNFYIDNGVPLVVGDVTIKPHDLIKEDVQTSGCDAKMMAAVWDVTLNDTQFVRGLASIALRGWAAPKTNWKVVADSDIIRGAGVDMYGVEECILKPLGEELDQHGRRAILGAIREAFGVLGAPSGTTIVRTQLQLTAQMDMGVSSLAKQGLMRPVRDKLVKEIMVLPLWDKKADVLGELEGGVVLKNAGKDMPDPSDPNAPRKKTRTQRAIEQLGKELDFGGGGGDVDYAKEPQKKQKKDDDDEEETQKESGLPKTPKDIERLNLAITTAKRGVNVLIEGSHDVDKEGFGPHHYYLFKVTGEGVETLGEPEACGSFPDTVFDKGALVLRGHYYELEDPETVNTDKMRFKVDSDTNAIVSAMWVRKAGFKVPRAKKEVLKMHGEFLEIVGTVDEEE